MADRTRMCEDDNHDWRRLGDGWARCRDCGVEMDEATLVTHDLLPAASGR